MMQIKHCLIIDDDEDDQEIFMMCVGKISKNIDCMAISDCVEALSMMKTTPGYTPDYIFLDVNMPKMNGLACLKELKRIERLKNAKIMMYSTTSEKSVYEESKHLGATDFIIKPVNIAELKTRLSNIFLNGQGTNS
jgi:PleD family two-component response regulator